MQPQENAGPSSGGCAERSKYTESDLSSRIFSLWWSNETACRASIEKGDQQCTCDVHFTHFHTSVLFMPNLLDKPCRGINIYKTLSCITLPKQSPSHLRHAHAIVLPFFKCLFDFFRNTALTWFAHFPPNIGFSCHWDVINGPIVNLIASSLVEQSLSCTIL